MNSDFEVLNNKDLFAPVVFRSRFNNFEKINSNQAWSLFFTGGKEDKKLGFDPEAGSFFNNILIALVVAGIVGGVVFTHLG